MVLKQNTKHFLHRAAFGPSLSENPDEANISIWMRNSGENKPIRVVEKPQISPGMKKGSKENIKQAFIQSRDQLIQLNSSWITQLTDPATALREKMTLFWHDHFACRVRSAYLAQLQNNTLRKLALGNFSDLLFAISKDPGMLQFLNNQQNKKDSPNENFAREILELFTLGRGYYTEDDIKNSARAFTGWSFNPSSGEFVFRDRAHDTGIKSFKEKAEGFPEKIFLILFWRTNKLPGLSLKKSGGTLSVANNEMRTLSLHLQIIFFGPTTSWMCCLVKFFPLPGFMIRAIEAIGLNRRLN